MIPRSCSQRDAKAKGKAANKALVTALCALIAQGLLQPGASARLLGPRQVEELPAAPPDRRLAYGSDPLQFGDLRLPKAPGPHPVAVVIHGGCWKSALADLENTAALASALTDLGIATWNVEYRRIDDSGGGWTGTFEDIARAIDYVRTLAGPYSLDLTRVIAVGHSAGGHLATWGAARHRLPELSPLYAKAPLRLAGVVNLAGPASLESFLPIQRAVCGDAVITQLLGGSPDEVPERYAEASPINLAPIGVAQILVVGARDTLVPAWLGTRYAREAQQKGDPVSAVVVMDAGHFEVIAPGSVAWPEVKAAVAALLQPGGRGAR
jgi:acetyl esterase/lipase